MDVIGRVNIATDGVVYVLEAGSLKDDAVLEAP